MVKIDGIGPRVIFSVILIVGLLNMPVPAFSQDDPNIQDLIINGGFEDGFQGEFGVADGWGGFSNGNTAVGWHADTWDKVVIAGQSAQFIEIRGATERNRYAGIYQTVSVVPGEQYKLTINGLIRSEEGGIGLSDYGYRLQYAVDYNGGTAWELIDDQEWVELPWDEQPLSDPPDGAYRFDTFETTIAARNETLTLFIRGWKKWVNNGSGIFDLDEISLVGPAPDGVEAPAVQAVSAGDPASPADSEPVTTGSSTQVSEDGGDLTSEQPQADETAPETDTSSESEIVSQTDTSSESGAAPETDTSASRPVVSPTQPAPSSPPAERSQLPVAGRGEDDLVNYIVLSGLVLLFVLFAGAITATIRPGKSIE